MGRPVKHGIDSFPLDVGFYSDIKIRKITMACGSQSASIIICLLCNIYRNNGYYMLFDNEALFVIAEECGVSEDIVKDVVDKALQVGFFSNELFEKFNILTSCGIQKRFYIATYQRKERVFNEDYLIYHAKNKVDCTKKEVVCIKNHKKETNKQAVKSKKTKKNDTSQQEKLDKRKKEFYESLVPFLSQYPKEMIRSFYNYWSEMNKSGTKMRFELERTWEVSKRLATWASRDNKFAKSSMDTGTILHDNSIEKYQNEDKWNR